MRTHISSPRLVHRALLTWALASVSVMGTTLAAPTTATPDRPAFVVTAPWALEGNYRPQSDGPPPKWQPPELSEAAPPPPLSVEQRKIVQATKSEKLPEPTWARFVMSNEWRHDVVFPKLNELGGVFVGVATDQNYTMAAAARAQLIVTMDYDSDVVYTHRIYHHFISASPTAEELRSYYTQANSPKAVALLQQVAETPEEGARLVRIYHRYRQRLALYLHQVAHVRVGNRHPTWLGDKTAYSYLRAMVQGGRVIAVQGDLNGTVALRSIGDTARALGLPVRVVYTSNAEGFFRYTQAFKDNLASLPHDEKTVVLRTYKRGMTAPEGDLWHYNLHKMDDFLARIASPGYPNVAAVMTDMRMTPIGRKLVEATGVSYYDERVPKTLQPAPAAAKPNTTKPAQPVSTEKANGPLAVRM